MSRQGIKLVRPGIELDLLSAAGVIVEAQERPPRTAVLHIHPDGMSKRFKRMAEDLDSMSTDHKAWYRGKKWVATGATVISEPIHKGHVKNKGVAFEYSLEVVG